MISSQRLIAMYFAISLCIAIALGISQYYETVDADGLDVLGIVTGFDDKAPDQEMTRDEMERSLTDRIDPDHITNQDTSINLFESIVLIFTFIWNVLIPIPLSTIGGWVNGDIIVKLAYAGVITIRSVLIFLLRFEIYLILRNKKAS